MLVQQHCRCSITTLAPVIMISSIASHTHELMNLLQIQTLGPTKELMLVRITGSEKELLNEASKGSRLTIFTRNTVAPN